MNNLTIENILNFVTSKDDKDLLEQYGGKRKRKSKLKKMKKKKKESDELDELEDESETDSGYEEEDESPGFFARIFGFKSPKKTNKIKRKLIRLSQEIYENKSIISSILDENPELADFVQHLQE